VYSETGWTLSDVPEKDQNTSTAQFFMTTITQTLNGQNTVYEMVQTLFHHTGVNTSSRAQLFG
jgi:predicted XRE-type DNA-binding protein